jgi:hypothetical protein
MFKKLILSICFALVPLCVFAQPIAETNPSDNTSSPKVTTEEREAPKEEKKSLKDLVITEPQWDGLKTTEAKEKK